jgi:DNA-binding protein HU-beta
MTKADLVESITVKAEGNLTRKAAEQLVDAVFEEIRRSVTTEGRFSYPPFGTWTIRERKARNGRNPRTKEAMIVPASRTVGFRPTPEVKEKL